MMLMPFSFIFDAIIVTLIAFAISITSFFLLHSLSFEMIYFGAATWYHFTIISFLSLFRYFLRYDIFFDAFPRCWLFSLFLSFSFLSDFLFAISFFTFLRFIIFWYFHFFFMPLSSLLCFRYFHYFFHFVALMPLYFDYFLIFHFD